MNAALQEKVFWLTCQRMGIGCHEGNRPRRSGEPHAIRHCAGQAGGALQQMITPSSGGWEALWEAGISGFHGFTSRILSTVSFISSRRRKSQRSELHCSNPVTNRELTHVLGEVLGKPTFMPGVPGFVMSLILGEFGSVLVKGHRVVRKNFWTQDFASLSRISKTR